MESIKVILEAIVISIYTGILHIYIQDIFILGFVKHFLAGILGLHRIYCKYNYINEHYNEIPILIIQSIIEGMLFVILYSLNVNIYVIPFILHVVFEILGLHKQFCLN